MKEISLPMGSKSPDFTVMRRWLHYLERAAERRVRHGSGNAIETALRIARRRMKLQRACEGKATNPDYKAEGYPITIFSQAIKEMEKRRRGSK